MTIETQIKVAIINVGVGNLHSVQKALNHLGANAEIVSDSNRVGEFDCLVLPGVGHYENVVAQFKKHRWLNVIKEWHAMQKPILGICLGMQLMFEGSEESPGCDGLGFFSGKAVSLRNCLGKSSKVPKIGWYSLNVMDSSMGVKENDVMYFVHSYAIPIDKKQCNASALVAYDGGKEFVAAIKAEKCWGVQFHPEKSMELGLNVYNEFLKIV